MPRLIALLLLPILSAVALGNAGPVFRVDYENEVKLAEARPGYRYFTLQVGLDKAELTPLDLSAEKWSTLSHRGTGDGKYVVELYCVPAVEVQKHDSPAKLLEAIRAGKAEHSKVAFDASEVVYKYREHRTQRARSVVTVNARGKMSVSTTPVEFAPEPRKISRLMLPGIFAALALAVGGIWLKRRR